MKFNEKLIELRKKEGLSQEELGYKLNVTRQTVSKWELGQTTPEMDKLVELSKIFNISVDELINESEIQNNSKSTIENQPIEKENKREKTIKVIILGVLIIVIILIITKLFTSFSIFNIFNKATNSQGDIVDKFFNVVDKAIDSMDKETNVNKEVKNSIDVREFNESTEILNEIKNPINMGNLDIFNEAKNQITVGSFNGPIEIFNGNQIGGQVAALLDSVIKSNKTEERKIIVKYKETETQSENEIKSIKQNIETFKNYEVTFEYDEEGFIKKTIIEKI